MPGDVQIKRIYDAAEPDDGYRVLIDHVWPRGVSKERAQLDDWARELAPSDELRRWFDHVPERFAEFRARYIEELARHADRIAGLAARARRRTATNLEPEPARAGDALWSMWEEYVLREDRAVNTPPLGCSIARAPLRSRAPIGATQIAYANRASDLANVLARRAADDHDEPLSHA